MVSARDPITTEAFHAGGEEELRRTFEISVQREVFEEFEPELAKASWWQRWRLLARMRREVDRRVAELMPQDADYLQSR